MAELGLELRQSGTWDHPHTCTRSAIRASCVNGPRYLWLTPIHTVTATKPPRDPNKAICPWLSPSLQCTSNLDQTLCLQHSPCLSSSPLSSLDLLVPQIILPILYMFHFGSVEAQTESMLSHQHPLLRHSSVYVWEFIICSSNGSFSPITLSPMTLF